MLPSQEQNPNGLYNAFYLQKIIQITGDFFGGASNLAPVDPDSEYFPLRLDSGNQDPADLKACRIAINAFADAIAIDRPQLATDIKDRYPLIP